MAGAGRPPQQRLSPGAIEHAREAPSGNTGPCPTRGGTATRLAVPGERGRQRGP